MENYFDATEMLNELNSKIKTKPKQMGNYKKNKTTIDFIDSLKRKGISNPVITNRGHNGVTLMHNEMKDHYTFWLNKFIPSIHYRNEDKFFDVLIPILKTEKTYEVKKQFEILNYKVDLMLFENFNDEIHACIIEYDEEHHKYNKNQDRIRQNEICDDLLNNFDYIEFIRVKESKHYESLKLLIPYLTGIKTSDICSELNDLCDIETYSRRVGKNSRVKQLKLQADILKM